MTDLLSYWRHSKTNITVAAELSNRPVARSHITVGAMGLLRYTSFAGGRGSCGFQEHSVLVLRAVSTLPPSTVQLPSASTSPSTHFVCFYTFYSYIFAAIFVQVMSPFYVYTHLRLYSTPTLICGCTAVSTVPDVWRCLYSTLTLTCGRTAFSIVPDVCRRLYSTPTFI